MSSSPPLRGPSFRDLAPPAATARAADAPPRGVHQPVRLRGHAQPAQECDEDDLQPAHRLGDGVIAARRELLGAHAEHAVEVSERHVRQVAVAHHHEGLRVAPVAKVRGDGLKATRLLVRPA